jgi:ribosomal protein S18 acetylase RimI-like enzyme
VPVRKATSADVPRLARAIAEAFDENPVLQWFFPDGARRVEGIARMLALELRKLALRRDHCFTTEAIDGGAIWFPPGGGAGALDEARMLPGRLRVFGGASVRALRGARAIDVHHPDAPHYYLEWLGVAPTARSRGAGAALMRPVLELCDRERMPAYLEATNPKARPLYERHGFEVTGEHAMPDGGPAFWSMWRTPA